MPAWKSAKNLMVSDPGALAQMIKDDASFVLIDLRNEGDVKKGHIPGAVSIPAGKLAASKGMFPADMGAPVILYGEGQASAEDFGTVRGWGYKNTSVLKGGLKGWSGMEGAKLTTGKAATDITYVKRLKPGEIGPAEFTAIVSERPTDKVILDVREGACEGFIPGAVTIPMSQLGARIAELPKDKEIIIHCNTGILAGSALKALKEKGYRARYLNAVLQVAPDGSIEISEK